MIPTPLASQPSIAERRTLGWLFALYLLLSLPFTFKPLHTDEPLFVWTAQQIVHHPFDYYGFKLNWENREQPVSQFFENPPLVSYYLAGVSFLTGWNEAALRLAVLPVNLLTLLGAWYLASEFCTRAGLAVTILICCPTFLICSTTLMCEPFSHCLWIWAVFLWVRGSKGSPSNLPIAGSLVAGAILSKYSSLCLIPLLATYAVIYPAPRQHRWMQFISLLIPVAVTATYEAVSSHLYGSGALAGVTGYLANARTTIHVPAMIRLINAFAFLGGGFTAVVLSALVLLGRRFLMLAVLFSIALAAAAAHFLLPPAGWNLNHSFSSSYAFFVQYALMFSGGIVIAVACGKVAIASWRHQQWRDELFLCLWIGGVFVFTAFFNWSINTRSTLPMLLPVAVLIVRGLDRINPFPLQRLRLLISVSAMLTFAVTYADYQLACTCRSAAGDLVRIAKSTTPIWFTGHSGFQYYMQAAGARELDATTPRFQTGDIAVFPTNTYGSSVGGKNFAVLGKLEFGLSHWLATIQGKMGANFYCSYGYDLPFVFGPIPPEAFALLRFTPETRIQKLIK